MQTGPNNHLMQFKEFTDSVFPAPLLNQREFEQLSWRLGSPIATPEKCIVDVTKDPAYLEAKRCLSRLHCLDLLVQGIGSYDDFITPQVRDDHYLPLLTAEQFQQLSQPFTTLTPLTRQTLRVATIISSITLSALAREKADQALGKNNYTIDSVEFLADTFRDILHARNIYPLVNDLFLQHPHADDQANITLFLQSAFASRCHYRHMLYTEGNEHMFDSLIENIRTGALTPEAFAFWKAYWTINITGFRGHLNPNGSVYLTSNTFRAMEALESSLDRIPNEAHLTAQDVLNDYLDKRSGQTFIHIQDLPDRTIHVDDKRLLAHIAAMMRLFSKDEGEALLEGYRRIPVTTMRKLRKSYFESTGPTPTYTPALFENGIDFRKQSYKETDTVLKQIHEQFFGNNIKFLANRIIRLIAIADVVVGLLPLNLEALNRYHDLKGQGQIPPNQPLSFAALANKKEVMAICGHSPIFTKFNILRYAQVSVDEKGNALVRAKPKLTRGKSKKSEISSSSSSLNLHEDRYFTPGYYAKRTRLQKRLQSSEQPQPAAPLLGPTLVRARG